jgi:FkbM family methyltransferase
VTEQTASEAAQRRDSAGGAHSTLSAMRKDPPRPGDTFLDIGANICVVSNWVAGLGCERVVGYEPLPLAVQAAHPAPGVELRPRAVTCDGRDITMAISKAAVERNYLCSGHAVSKGNVAQIEFTGIKSDAGQAVIDELRPTYVKIDIEGGEYELLPAIDLSDVRAMFFEMHGCNSPRQAVLLPLILHRLWRQGLTPSHGWALNPRWDARTDGTTLCGIGFWREVQFVRGTAEPAGMRVMLDGVKRILDSGKFPGPGRLCPDALFQQLVKEELQ